MRTKLIPRISAWLAVPLLCAPAMGAEWTFAVLGDTRGDHDTTTTGVSPYLNTIAQKIATLHPELVMMGGDLVNGNDVPETSPLRDYSLQFDYWKTAMAPVFNYTSNTGIPIYTVRGNHENVDNDTGPPIDGLKKAYYDAFKAYVPLNGPNYGSTNDQTGFTYSFTQNNVSFVVADQYFYYTNAAYHDLDRAWVAQQFQQSSSAYKVFMAHEPVFSTEGGGGEDGGFFGSDSTGLQNREDFWNALGTNGVQLYLTGHIHNETVARTTNDYGNSIIQLMAGNGGAPLDPVGINHDPAVDVLYTNGLFGFALATVTDTNMTLHYYSLHTNDDSWTVADYVTSIAPNQLVPEPSISLLLTPPLAVWMARRFLKRERP